MIKYLRDQMHGQDAIIHGFCNHVPHIITHEESTLSLSAQDIAAIDKIRADIAAHPIYTNEPHAILKSDVNWNADPVTFKTEIIDFATMRYFRHIKRPFRALSASALLICPENKTVIMHKRAAHSDTYPNVLHVFGGGYLAAGAHHDQSCLKNTAIREIREEIGLDVTLDHCPMILMEEPSSGFINLCFLGCEITPDMMDNITLNDEGDILSIPYDDLDHRLKAIDDFIPTGRAAILAWRGL